MLLRLERSADVSQIMALSMYTDADDFEGKGYPSQRTWENCHDEYCNPAGTQLAFI